MALCLRGAVRPLTLVTTGKFMMFYDTGHGLSSFKFHNALNIVYHSNINETYILQFQFLIIIIPLLYI